MLAGRVHFPEENEVLLSHLLGGQAIRDLNSNLFPRRTNPDKSIDAAIGSLFAFDWRKLPGLLDPPVVTT